MPEALRAVPRTVPSLALRRGTAALIDRVEKLVGETIREPHPSAAVLHDLHREMRRLAISLTLFARFLPRTDEATIEPVVKRIRRLARLVGRVRDRDVTAALLLPELRRPLPPNEQRRLRRFLGRMQDDARTARELLKAYLHTARGSGALGQAREALARPLRRGADPVVSRRWAREAAEFERKLRKALRRARRTLTPERLHRLRIRIRQHRQLTNLTGAFGSSRAPHGPSELKELQDRLGRIHDLDVALATLPPGLEASTAARRLRSRRQGQRARVRSLLTRPKVSRGRRPGTRAAAPAGSGSHA
jgi:CHAD domain-containing protein